MGSRTLTLAYFSFVSSTTSLEIPIALVCEIFSVTDTRQLMFLAFLLCVSPRNAVTRTFQVLPSLLISVVTSLIHTSFTGINSTSLLQKPFSCYSSKERNEEKKLRCTGKAIGFSNYQMPAEGKAGPQSHEKLACILRIWFTWHCPLYSLGTHTGRTMYLFFCSLYSSSATLTAERNVTFNRFCPSCIFRMNIIIDIYVYFLL